MHSNDKSFQTLIMSLAAHLGLFLLALNINGPSLSPPTVTSIELIDPSEPKSKAVVIDSEENDMVKQLRDQADYLSKLNRRVQEQMAARDDRPKNLRALSRSQAQQQPQTQPGETEKVKVTTKTAQELIREAQQRRSQDLTLQGSPIGTSITGENSAGEYIPGLKEGAFTALNTDRSTYYTFYERVDEQIRNRWKAKVRDTIYGLTTQALRELAVRDRTTQIEVILDPDGTLQNILVHRSSGYVALDQAATSSFREAAPLNNPPKGMIQSDGLIHLHYVFTLYFSPTAFAGDKSN